MKREANSDQNEKLTFGIASERTKLLLKTLLRMVRLLLGISSGQTIVLIACELMAALLPIAQIWVTVRLMDAAMEVYHRFPEGLTNAYGIVGIQLLILLVGIGADMAKQHATNVLRTRTAISVGSALAFKTSSMSLLAYEDHEVHNRLQRIAGSLDMRILQFFQSALALIMNVVTLVGYLLVLYHFHWLLAGGLLLLIVPLLFIHFKESRLTFNQMVRQTPMRRRADYLFSLMSNRQWAKEVRIFDLAEHITQQWKSSFQQNADEQNRLDLRMSLQKTTVFAFSFGIIACITAGLLRLASLGRIGIAEFAALIQVAVSVQSQLRALAAYTATIFENALFASEVFLFLDAEHEAGGRQQAKKSEASEHRRRLDAPIQSVVFRNVGFTYPQTNRKVLEQLSFEIRAGEKIALVGENGSGKSTLVKCLLGLYPVTEGTVEYNDVDAKEWETASLRSRLTAIFQDFVQYQLSLRENIGFGRVKEMHDETRLQTAAAQSGVEEFADRLPEGFETQLGYAFMGGHELSHGQWQKISISRAFFKNADLIVLDEPTSALDPLAEAALFEKLAQLAEGRTTLFISHRLGICRAADRVLVLKNGRLVEQGRHEDLIEAGGEYARMFRVQADWYRK